MNRPISINHKGATKYSRTPQFSCHNKIGDEFLRRSDRQIDEGKCKKKKRFDRSFRIKRNRISFISRPFLLQSASNGPNLNARSKIMRPIADGVSKIPHFLSYQRGFWPCLGLKITALFCHLVSRFVRKQEGNKKKKEKYLLSLFTYLQCAKA